MRITIKPDFLIRKIAGEYILIGAGKQIDFSQLLLLNETAVFLIRKLQEHSQTFEELAQQMITCYLCRSSIGYSRSGSLFRTVTSSRHFRLVLKKAPIFQNRSLF